MRDDCSMLGDSAQDCCACLLRFGFGCVFDRESQSISGRVKHLRKPASMPNETNGFAVAATLCGCVAFRLPADSDHATGAKRVDFLVKG